MEASVQLAEGSFSVIGSTHTGPHTLHPVWFSLNELREQGCLQQQYIQVFDSIHSFYLQFLLHAEQVLLKENLQIVF